MREVCGGLALTLRQDEGRRLQERSLANQRPSGL